MEAILQLKSEIQDVEERKASLEKQLFDLNRCIKVLKKELKERKI